MRAGVRRPERSKRAETQAMRREFEDLSHGALPLPYATSYSETYVRIEASPSLRFGVVWASLLVLVASRPRAVADAQYELRGQILAVDSAPAARSRSSTRTSRVHAGHDDAVQGQGCARCSRAASAGDLVRATLVVEGLGGRISQPIERTGHAPLTEPPPPAARSMRCSPETKSPTSTLVDETGATRRLSEWRGRALAVTFIYTRCPLPDFCPLMDRQFADVQQTVMAADAVCAVACSCCRSASIRSTTRRRSSRRTRRKSAPIPRRGPFSPATQADIESFAALFGVSVMREGSDPGSVVHNLRTARHRRPMAAWSM